MYLVYITNEALELVVQFLAPSREIAEALAKTARDQYGHSYVEFNPAIKEVL